MKTYYYRPARIAAMVLIAALGVSGLKAQDVQKEGFVDPKALVDENARRTPTKLTKEEQKLMDAKDKSWVDPGIMVEESVLPEESVRKTPLKLTAEDLKIKAAKESWVDPGLMVGSAATNVHDVASASGGIVTYTVAVPGDRIEYPIVIGTYGAYFTWSNTQNTGNFTNTYTGRPTNDVFYVLTLNCAMEVEIKTCGSGLADTYVTLLNSTGEYITRFDDSQTAGTCSTLTHEYVKITLDAGTYYIVCEGWSQNGSITTQISGRPGNTMATAINAGTYSAFFTWSDIQNTGNFTNTYTGRSTNDVFYRFTLNCPMEVELKTCGSGLADTYITLLNGSGGYLQSFDDAQEAGSCSSLRHENVKKTLSAGAYYIVCEGWSQNGSITTQITGRPGNSMATAINAGTVTASSSYTNTQNTGNFTNSYEGRPTNDVFYKFTIPATTNVIISHCGSEVSDTYVSLLDSNGTYVDHSDDLHSGGCSNGMQGYLIANSLPAGTYYVVTESWSQHGNITTKIAGAVVAGIVSPASQTVANGGSVTLSHTGYGSGITSRLWQFSDNGGSAWTSTSATGTSYSTGALTNTGSSSITRRYRVQLNGEATCSAESVITVTPPVAGSITIRPTTQPVVAGSTVTLTHTGSSGITSRQWQMSAGNGSAWTDLPGATGTTYSGSLTNYETSDVTQKYRVKINGMAIYSAELAVTVTSAYAFAPSANQNYIHTITPQTATASIPAGARNRAEYSEAIEYFDGLGRPVQTVDIGASPEGLDIVTPFVYDRMGREVKKHLPYRAETGNGAYKSDFATRQQAFYNNLFGSGERPYGETEFEHSPLNRAVKETGPGKDWKINGKHVTSSYKINTSNEVLWWNADDTQVFSYRNYPGGKLFVTEITDEDGKKTTEYKDLQGRTVRRKQWVGGSDYAITDFVYDDFEQLRYVLPPAIAKDTIRTVTVSASSSSEFTRFVYAYRYDTHGRAVETHIPGAGWTYTVYNRLDLPVLTQDADQRTRNEWSFTKYDAFGRAVMTGVLESQNTRSDWENAVKNTAAQWEYRAVAMKGYTNVSQPAVTDAQIHAVHYYDDYDFDRNSAPDYAYGGSLARPQGLPTGSHVKVLDSSPEEWLVTVMFYDTKGRVVHTIAGQPKVGSAAVKDEVTNSYTFTGALSSSTRTHYKGGSAMFTLTVANDYDHAGRLTAVRQNIGTGNVTVAENACDALGQLSQTVLHGGLETIGYAYNIRGWLTAINGQAFSEKLHYNDLVPGIATDPNWDDPQSHHPQWKPQWSGNISAVEWQTPALNDKWHAHRYVYDNLNRLTWMNYKSKPENTTAYPSDANASERDRYALYLGYKSDMMGNISWMTRVQNKEYWDDLSFSYSGNQVVKIHDVAETMAGKGFIDHRNSYAAYYLYDPAGRMIRDNNMNRTIAYNHLGLTTSVVQGSDTLSYIYDGTGRRVKKRFGNLTRYYADGVECSGDTTIIHTEYGRIRRNAVTDPWKLDYFLKDHLGNVRVVLDAGTSTSGASFSSSGGSVTYLATMEESKAATEDQYFANLNETRADAPYNYPDKNPLNAKLSKVPGKSKGLSILLRVLAGDTISISAKAFYNMDKTLPGKSIDIAPVLGSAITAMTNSTGMILSEATRLTVDLGAEAS
ncbi:MAG: DUF6443 domain-containing protein, partial [Bacteroidales bacterium]|nr:DUF6443 domain-containing protein [Bacteroidales bacterium]